LLSLCLVWFSSLVMNEPPFDAEGGTKLFGPNEFDSSLQFEFFLIRWISSQPFGFSGERKRYFNGSSFGEPKFPCEIISNPNYNVFSIEEYLFLCEKHIFRSCSD